MITVVGSKQKLRLIDNALDGASRLVASSPS